METKTIYKLIDEVIEPLLKVSNKEFTKTETVERYQNKATKEIINSDEALSRMVNLQEYEKIQTDGGFYIDFKAKVFGKDALITNTMIDNIKKFVEFTALLKYEKKELNEALKKYNASTKDEKSLEEIQSIYSKYKKTFKERKQRTKKNTNTDNQEN